MRQGQQNRRGRGRNNNGHNHTNHTQSHTINKRGQNPLSRNHESNGPGVKIRGNAAHVAEKYMSLARDALSSGDNIMAENYLQHAEHYNRIIMSAQQPGEGMPGVGLGQRPRTLTGEYGAADEDGDGDGDDLLTPGLSGASGVPVQNHGGQQNPGHSQGQQHNRNGYGPRGEGQRGENQGRDGNRNDGNRNDGRNEGRNEGHRGDVNRGESHRGDAPRNEGSRGERFPRDRDRDRDGGQRRMQPRHDQPRHDQPRHDQSRQDQPPRHDQGRSEGQRHERGDGIRSDGGRHDGRQDGGRLDQGRGPTRVEQPRHNDFGRQPQPVVDPSVDVSRSFGATAAYPGLASPPGSGQAVAPMRTSDAATANAASGPSSAPGGETHAPTRAFVPNPAPHRPEYAGAASESQPSENPPQGAYMAASQAIAPQPAAPEATGASQTPAHTAVTFGADGGPAPSAHEPGQTAQEDEPAAPRRERAPRAAGPDGFRPARRRRVVAAPTAGAGEGGDGTAPAPPQGEADVALRGKDEPDTPND